MKTFLLIFFVLVSHCSLAIYSQVCGVSFEDEGEWSHFELVEVTFVTGNELNEMQGTYDYQQYELFAFIEFKNDDYLLIKISSYTGCGLIVDWNCINNKSYNLEGADQFGRDWEICTREICS